MSVVKTVGTTKSGSQISFSVTIMFIIASGACISWWLEREASRDFRFNLKLASL